MNPEEKDHRFTEIKNASQICFKCGGINSGISYTVSSGKYRSLKIRRVRFGHRGMHEDCAKAWIERVKSTPENHQCPEIEAAQKSYDRCAEQAQRDIERIRAEIQLRDRRLTDRVFRFHQEKIRELKGEKKCVFSPQTDARHLKFVALENKIACAAEGLRNGISDAVNNLKSALMISDWLSVRREEESTNGCPWLFENSFPSVCEANSNFHELIKDIQNAQSCLSETLRSLKQLQMEADTLIHDREWLRAEPRPKDPSPDNVKKRVHLYIVPFPGTA